MRNLVALLLLAVPVGCSQAPPAIELGEYLYLGSEHLLELPTVRLDETGIPETYYELFGWQRNPVIVVQWGLSEHARFLTHHEPAQHRAFLTASDWLLSTQRPDGAWAYDYPWNNGVTDLEVPWISAIQQGMAISLLARAYDCTGQQRYLDAALSAMRPLAVHVDQGGLRDDHEGVGPVLEEYPAPGGSSHVLNGWMFALIGLHELHALTGNELALQIFSESEAALRQLLPLYQSAKGELAWSTYDLRHLLGGPVKLVSGGYMRLQAYELRYLFEATGHQPYEDLRLAWEASARESGVPDLPSDRF